jgi:hypothetical protein
MDTAISTVSPRTSNVLDSLPSHVPPLLKGGAFFIDNSTYDSILQCERMGLWKVVHQRQLRGKASALNFGGAVHAGLQVRYASGGLAHESLAEQVKHGLDHLARNPVELGDWRTPSVLQEVLIGYAREYPVEDFQVFTLDGKPLVELAFAVPLGVIHLPAPLLIPSVEDTDDRKLTDVEKAQLKGGRVILREMVEIPVIWTGKIDMVIDRGDGLWLADHKTTSVFGPTYFEQFHLAGQFSGYSFALEQCLGRLPLGVLINALAIRQETRTGKGTTFHRAYLPIPEQQVREWQTNTLNVLSNFFQGLYDGNFPMRTCSCRTKWQRNCEYLGVCQLSPESRQIYLHSGDFETTHWSPLNQDS